MGLLVPGQALAIKQVSGVDSKIKKQLAEREEEILKALGGKTYAPNFYGSCSSLEVEEKTGDMQPCANLILG